VPGAIKTFNILRVYNEYIPGLKAAKI